MDMADTAVNGVLDHLVHRGKSVQIQYYKNLPNFLQVWPTGLLRLRRDLLTPSRGVGQNVVLTKSVFWKTIPFGINASSRQWNCTDILSKISQFYL